MPLKWPELLLGVIRSGGIPCETVAATVLDEMVATLVRSCGESLGVLAHSRLYEIVPPGYGEPIDRGCQKILLDEANHGLRHP